MSLQGKTVALGVTGGIAAYKACSLVSLLKKNGADVHVVMTKNAREFVRPLTLETLTKNPVITDTFRRRAEFDVQHISLAKKADIFVVAPATANFIAKFAHGIADDFLSTTVMAYQGPVLLAPAMNTVMLQSPANQANTALLASRGVHFIDGADGVLACGDEGKGRMAEPEEIAARIEEIFEACRAAASACPVAGTSGSLTITSGGSAETLGSPPSVQKSDLAGKTVLVTAGATREPIDPVRYITNRSSGKMGIAIAEAAARRGARVILVHGEIKVDSGQWTVDRKEDENPIEPSTVNRQPPTFSESRITAVKVETTDEMCRAVMQYLPESDIVIKAAAPSDYKVVAQSPQKIKSENLTLNLVKNVDIAAEVGRIKGDKKLVVFAAETEDLIKNAQQKLKNKNADLIVANDITKEGAGFSVDTNIVTLISRKKSVSYDKMPKAAVANLILDWVTEL
ncbi:MAG: bifunctional phosphopantothenoylcysteine decarboxylase/phosphopantothenate synthase [Firmicutes bacterium]|nr:bifunctional phosphopantothenoylcysteine decarboxylase/phosphopantothenate synthase [Bacillota bacterium]